MNSKITGIGAYVPEKILSNSDFEKIVNTNDEWIVKADRHKGKAGN